MIKTVLGTEGFFDYSGKPPNEVIKTMIVIHFEKKNNKKNHFYHASWRSFHLIFVPMPTEEISEESFIVIFNLNSF